MSDKASRPVEFFEFKRIQNNWKPDRPAANHPEAVAQSGYRPGCANTVGEQPLEATIGTRAKIYRVRALTKREIGGLRQISDQLRRCGALNERLGSGVRQTTCKRPGGCQTERTTYQPPAAADASYATQGGFSIEKGITEGISGERYEKGIAELLS